MKSKMELITERERGCKHTERPIVKNCYKCGKGLCYECSMELITDTRVVSWYSFTGSVIRDYEYGYFCPYCFLDEIYKSKIPKKPKFLVPFGIGTLIVFIICLLFMLPISWGAWILFAVVEIIMVLPISARKYKRKKKPYTRFKAREEYALRLLTHDSDT
jgi:hypothetical protein